MSRRRAFAEDGPATVSSEVAAAIRKRYKEQPEKKNEGPIVDPKVKEFRERVWAGWSRITEPDTDVTERFWIDFARYPHRHELQTSIKSFLEIWYEESTTTRVVLGPEERITVPAITSAHTMVSVLRALIAAADAKVLQLKRDSLRERGRGDEAARLFLKWDNRNERREGPSFKTVQWILNDFADEFDLRLRSEYEKVEATGEDIMACIKALYHRAEDISAPPLLRVSFHFAILELGAGGFRPSMVMVFKCKDLELTLVRDPRDRTKFRPVVTSTVDRNKLPNDRSSRQTGNNKNPIGFSTPVLPFHMLCLASLVIGRAMQMGALETTVHEFFHCPDLGAVDVIKVPWKEGFEEEIMFQLTYNQFWRIWRSCTTVIGCRKAIRPYALRVGAGSRMDDKLSSALRNYVMSHTSIVYQENYQTRNVRENLIGIAFGPENVDGDEQLFQCLRQMGLSRDEGAPRAVPKEQMGEFETRKDITTLRAELRGLCSPERRSELVRQIASTKATWIRLRLEANRQLYFKQADQLRLQGHQPEPTPGVRGPGVAAHLASFIGPLKAQDRGVQNSSLSERYIEAVMDFLSGRLSTSVGKESPEASVVSSSHKRPCCFLCSKRFKERSGLTRHFKTNHLNDGTFDKPVVCSACPHSGAAAATFRCPQEWCNHLEHTHGRDNTPAYNPGVSQRDTSSMSPTLSCLLCPMTLARHSLVLHVNRVEIPKFRNSYDGSYRCHLCALPGRPDVEIATIWDSLEHARTVHAWAIPNEPCLVCGQLCVSGTGFQKHCASAHTNLEEAPQQCGACAASASPNQTSLTSLQQLFHHAMEMHPSMGVRTDPTIRKRKRDDEDTANKRTVGNRSCPVGVSYLDTEAQFADTGGEDGELERTFGEQVCISSTKLCGIPEREFLSRVDPRLLIGVH